MTSPTQHTPPKQAAHLAGSRCLSEPAFISVPHGEETRRTDVPLPTSPGAAGNNFNPTWHEGEV